MGSWFDHGQAQDAAGEARARRAGAGAAGRSRREIERELGIGDDLAKAFLRGVPLPESLARPRAKDADREAAIALREAGRTYDQIAEELGISKSTCSLWLRHLPHPEVQPPVVPEPVRSSDLRLEEARQMRIEGRSLREIGDALGVSAKTAYYWTWDLPVPPRARAGGDPAHMEMMRRRYWDRVLAEREAERQAVREQHAAQVGALTPRELELAAVVAYWCEGTKSKPYERRETVVFINSDAGLILLFLAWLDQVDFPRQHRRFTVSIHESADVEGAITHWAKLIDVDPAAFSRPNLKRHNPKTARKNVGEAYVGCLVIRLVQCRELYQRIEGTWQGIMGGLPQGGADDLSRVV